MYLLMSHTLHLIFMGLLGLESSERSRNQQGWPRRIRIIPTQQMLSQSLHTEVERWVPLWVGQPCAEDVITAEWWWVVGKETPTATVRKEEDQFSFFVCLFICLGWTHFHCQTSLIRTWASMSPVSWGSSSTFPSQLTVSHSFSISVLTLVTGDTLQGRDLNFCCDSTNCIMRACFGFQQFQPCGYRREILTWDTLRNS